MCATKPSKRARWMKGRCAEYALTSRFVCSLLGMSLDWTAMTGSSRRITEDLRQPKCAAAEASGVAWGSARHRSRAVARDCARRSRKTPGSGVAAREARRRQPQARRARDTARRVAVSPAAPAAASGSLQFCVRVAIRSSHCAEACARISQQPCSAERPHRCRLIDSYWPLAAHMHDSASEDWSISINIPSSRAHSNNVRKHS